MKKILLFVPAKHDVEHVPNIMSIEKPSDAVYDVLILKDDPHVDIWRNLVYKWHDAMLVCLDRGYDYLFCVEQDIFLPDDALIKLLAARLPIVSGLYVYRENDEEFNGKIMCFKNNQPIVPGLDFVQGDIVNVDRIPLGCLLLQREVVEKVIVHMDTGGDATFCHEAKKHGYRLSCHTGVLCGHKTIKDEPVSVPVEVKMKPAEPASVEKVSPVEETKRHPKRTEKITIQEV